MSPHNLPQWSLVAAGTHGASLSPTSMSQGLAPGVAPLLWLCCLVLPWPRSLLCDIWNVLELIFMT